MIIDISPLVSPRLAVWPGDIPLSRQVQCDISRGDNITLSSINATVHLGTHADAPSHYGASGRAIHEQPLEPYLGRSQVIRVEVGCGERIKPEQVKVEIRAERVLFATGTYPDPQRFNTDFAALSPEVIHWLADRGVILVGIDTPSVDLFDSKDLPSHQAALTRDVALLEGLMLERVEEGEYELIALPLKLEGFDASPVRAVLRTLEK